MNAIAVLIRNEISIYLVVKNKQTKKGKWLGKLRNRTRQIQCSNPFQSSDYKCGRCVIGPIVYLPTC